MNIKIYTDGACQGNQFKTNTGGWAALIFSDKKTEPIKILSGCKSNTTNNKMELTACLSGLIFVQKYIKTKRVEGIEIYTDSAYIANCFKQKWWARWEKNNWKTSNKNDVRNKELWQKIIKLYKDLPGVKFSHIRAHKGNKFNEMADKIAVEAIKKCR